MMRLPTSAARWAFCFLSAAALSACGDTAKHSIEDGMGPDPVLPDPVKRMIPTVKVAEVKRWAEGAAPVPAEGLAVQAFARDLDHPRWMYVLPNGDVLVAETAAPPAPEKEGSGLRDKIQGAMMAKAGSTVPSANRITLLRDADGDGVAEVRTQFLKGLYSPFGITLVGDRLYVANADALVSFPYKEGDTQISAAPRFVANLPGGINHHWTKSLLASRDGNKLYVGVGSNSNVAENGMDAELNRAAILEVDAHSGATRVFASGLRNPVGLAWQPGADTLWVVVNERDEIGSDLVPDYLTSVREGGFYGWPYSYYGQHVDERVQPQNAEMVASAIKPDYALGPHTASLGLTFYEGALLPQAYRGGAFIGQHGSWNRDPPSGYKVIYVPFANGKPSGKAQDVLTGFLDAEGKAQGRPVGVAVDKPGALLVADDVGNVIWRVTPKAGP
ncbi:PQQ-dependent sugar dehydrogenase [Xanthomonas translucens]|uniref:PQQ-dependent sugar dehydrogenase n=1 Tax=Xanthomonas campestris pv. translucens TaxID=343 RepID=UPI00034ABE93|nr:sorbosone dehydrogenase family protein [Xanthomonas translucens]MCT8280423.1 sorbosone dehydrogenase family protein [Xanthomonas translucens pv. undulosa]MCT8315235.1 sorbosone dehydrogenase family protein [Xanthomonas translucens pv. undulosa]QSQ55801.1 sorbosone dehydrogenase family protein [Xanthomonas translucens pv. undulosa]UKE39381.1 sorbosone dehydrogenase family protein [Xanthomonas translucens pv. undulosa]UKE43088.1 sorbosone dehydrogenase family protein [Xanthomonas translucens 